MAQPKKGLDTLGLRLPKDVIKKIKVFALQHDTTASEIAGEALSLWWAQHPANKTAGPLFDDPSAAATPVASDQGEPSTPKKEEKKAAPAVAAKESEQSSQRKAQRAKAKK